MGTKKGAFTFMPLPKIDELFALLKGVKYFTALDLWSGYYHTKLDEESIPKSAFTTVLSKFEFLRLPFGLSQGPDFFICLIYDLCGLLFAYLIFRPHPDLQQHWKRTPANVRQSFQTFTQSQTQNQVEQMFILYSANSLFRPATNWNVYPSTCQ